MDKLNGMRAFVAVAETGGFASAARRLSLSRALVSRYVGQLEESLSVRLFNRTTRRVSLTTVGQAYYERCAPLLEELLALESSVREAQERPVGELRVSAPVSFAELHLMELVAAFGDRYPALRIDLQLTDRMVDMVAEGLDVSLRITELADSSLVARRLAPVRVVTCAAPDYLQAHGQPCHPSELARHRCLVDSNLGDSRHWLFREQGETLRVAVDGAIRVNGARAIRELAVAGRGIAMSPLFVVADDVRAGRLTMVLSDFEYHDLALYALYPHRRHLTARVRLFVEALREHFSGRAPWEILAALPPAQ